MARTRVSLVITMMILLAAAPALAHITDPGDAQVKLNRPKIHIINEGPPGWEIKVWAYSGQARQAEIYSCQTLHYSPAYSRTIDPYFVRSPLDRPFLNHCGNYDTLTFWFRAWHRPTGVYNEYTTFGIHTPWGASWTWDGSSWTCVGCQ